MVSVYCPPDILLVPELDDIQEGFKMVFTCLGDNIISTRLDSILLPLLPNLTLSKSNYHFSSPHLYVLQVIPHLRNDISGF